MKFTRFGLLVFAIAFVAVTTTAAPAQAYTGMNADELRSEIARLSRVADNIRAQLLKYDNSTVATTACLQAGAQMRRGSRGASVSALQQFLVQQGVYSAGLITGYYGPATEAGVQRWQASYGIVSYGTPASTGYGRVGPSTLRAMRAGCTTAIVPPTLQTQVPQAVVPTPLNISVERYSLSASPTRGDSPLLVSVNLDINGSTCTSYVLDWGDGTLPIVYDSNKSSGCTSKPVAITRTHIYTTPGTYSIKIKNGKAPIANIKQVNSIPIEVL